jgi:hypothetical protein
LPHSFLSKEEAVQVFDKNHVQQFTSIILTKCTNGQLYGHAAGPARAAVPEAAAILLDFYTFYT